ncbi:polygalacturonase inhibitor 2-like [Aristolochia californica]|uniref:polygalacturonase inhibitor 2-like n=1 Tax=Aristolochia californica TaxID=171875 RepID=UPI0035D93DB3
MSNISGSPPYITLSTNSYTYIDLSYNKFTGPTPFLTNLVYFLDISYNQFSGVIPLLFGKMKGLEILNLSHNNLTRGVPQPWLTMDLSSGNEFSGSLPSWIGVWLSHPLILQQRAIPRSITNFFALRTNRVTNNKLVYRGTYYKERVDVSMNGFAYEYTTNLALKNQFFGKLPLSIGRLKQLINLDLLRNYLSRSIYVGNDSLYGYPLRKECKSNGRDQIPVQPFGDEEFEDGSKMRWIYADIVPGFAFGFETLFGILLFKSYKYCSSSNSREFNNPKVSLLPMEPKGRRNTKKSEDTTPTRAYGDIPGKKD